MKGLIFTIVCLVICLILNIINYFKKKDYSFFGKEVSRGQVWLYSGSLTVIFFILTIVQIFILFFAK